MLPGKKNSIWNCNAVYELYEKLLNPCIQTVESDYLFPILKKQLQYSEELKRLLSLAIINIPVLPPINTGVSLKNNMLLSRIITTIKSKLRPTDMIFYNGAQEVIFLLPGIEKNGTKKLLNRIESDLGQIYIDNNPLVIKAGYAEFPADSSDFIGLYECTFKALDIAMQSQKNRIIGYYTERRKKTRIPLNIEVRYNKQNIGEHITCCRNLSEEGILISGMPDLPKGNNIKLSFKLPKPFGIKINITAKTIWNKIHKKTSKIDIGLCFSHINSYTKQKIKEFIQSTNTSIAQP